MRLSSTTQSRISSSVERYAYDRDAQKVGIVHFGIGAFHRAHQAWYTDRAMDAGDRDWMIAGISLRSGDVAAQLNPQDGLFTLTERSAAGLSTRLVGSVREVLVAPQNPAGLAMSLSAPDTRIVSLTITEKGYCRAADGSLDHALARAGSIYPALAAAFRQRQAAGIDGLTLLSCDNLADNGKQLRRLTGEYLAAAAPDLLGWFERECACPATMVDRIVPATTAADRAEIAEILDCCDEAAVMTEPFSQWVIENQFATSRPAWETVGAQLVTDVAPYETAKLRMLNGAHSALAYLGLERGHTFVHQAIADPGLRPLIEELIRSEAAGSFTAAPGQDLRAYADALVARFANPALNHSLAQIAMDGSQKIPQRWLATLADQQAKGRRCPVILTALAAWLRHLRGTGAPVNDPQAEALGAIVRSNDIVSAARAIFTAGGLLAGAWQPREDDFAQLARERAR